MKKLFRDVFSRIPMRAVGGEEYCYECYGKNARYLDLESNVTIIFDEETEQIYEITVIGDDADPEMIWRDPDHKDSFFTEMKKRRAIEMDEDALKDEIIQARLVTVEDINVIINRIRRLFQENDEFNRQKHQ